MLDDAVLGAIGIVNAETVVAAMKAARAPKSVAVRISEIVTGIRVVVGAPI